MKTVSPIARVGSETVAEATKAGTLSATDNGQRTTDNKGFTLIEIIIAVLLLAIAIAPMVSAFAPAIFSTGGEEEMAVFANRARATLNRVTALDFKTLHDNKVDPVDLAALFGSAAEAAKETFSFKGTDYTPSVAISGYDADGDNDIDDDDEGVLEISVRIAHVSLRTLKAEY